MVENLSREELIEQLGHANEQIMVEKAWNTVTQELVMELATKLSQIWQIWVNEPSDEPPIDKIDKIMDEDVIPLLMKAGLNEYGE